ncbi:hypothetical protein IJ818_07615 [bacterium]|nr:hypothetical protein [bacterium]
MVHKRWYDKNPKLSELIAYLEEQERNVQDAFSQHLLQILIYEFNFNLDEQISKLSEPWEHPYNRWYDENIELFTIVQFIKTLSYDEQSYLVDSVVSHVLIDNLKEKNND